MNNLWDYTWKCVESRGSLHNFDQIENSYELVKELMISEKNEPSHKTLDLYSLEYDSLRKINYSCEQIDTFEIN